MKSIKEKAIELKTELLLNRATITEIYTAGAYYVLDHLSKTIAISEDGYLYDNLKKMIEQLKK